MHFSNSSFQNCNIFLDRNGGVHNINECDQLPSEIRQGYVGEMLSARRISFHSFNILVASFASNGSKVLIIQISILKRLHVPMNLFPRAAVQGSSKV